MSRQRTIRSPDPHGQQTGDRALHPAHSYEFLLGAGCVQLSITDAPTQGGWSIISQVKRLGGRSFQGLLGSPTASELPCGSRGWSLMVAAWLPQPQGQQEEVLEQAGGAAGQHLAMPLCLIVEGNFPRPLKTSLRLIGHTRSHDNAAYHRGWESKHPTPQPLQW